MPSAITVTSGPASRFQRSTLYTGLNALFIHTRTREGGMCAFQPIDFLKVNYTKQKRKNNLIRIYMCDFLFIM